jgi:hypothetical protein
MTPLAERARAALERIKHTDWYAVGLSEYADAIREALELAAKAAPALGQYETEFLPAILRAIAGERKDGVAINALTHAADALAARAAPTSSTSYTIPGPYAPMMPASDYDEATLFMCKAVINTVANLQLGPRGYCSGNLETLKSAAQHVQAQMLSAAPKPEDKP